MTIRRTFAIAALGAIALAACGGDDPSNGSGGDATRTLEIDMVDIAFEPDSFDVDAGETIRFVFTNSGAVAHDAFIGDAAAQAAHETEMRAAEEDGHGGHDDDGSDAVTVEPGDTGELTHTFGDPGTVEIGCHQPGHYDAGMKVGITVA